MLTKVAKNEPRWMLEKPSEFTCPGGQEENVVGVFEFRQLNRRSLLLLLLIAFLKIKTGSEDGREGKPVQERGRILF